MPQHLVSHVGIAHAITRLEEQADVELSHILFQRVILAFSPVPLVIGHIREAGCVRKHLAHGDSAAERVLNPQFRQVLPDIVLQHQFPVLHQLHHRCGCERLGDRCHVEQGMLCHRFLAVQLTYAIARLQQYLAIFYHAHSSTYHPVGFH